MNRIKSIFLLAIMCIAVSCTGNKKKNESITKEERKAFIENCSAPLIEAGAEAAEAREVCDCLLGKLLETHPNLLDMESEDLEEILLSDPSMILECLGIDLETLSGDFE